MKFFYSFLFLLSVTLSGAQEFERIEVDGIIVVPKSFNSAGIHIYNKNSGTGSVSGAKGNFSLKVRAQDSLYFSGLQFREMLVVITPAVILEKRLVVEVQVGVNELPEVVLRNHDLTGNLKSDSENIEVVELDLPAKSAFSINDYDYEFRPDVNSKVTNIATGSSGLKHGANILGLVGLLTNTIFKKDKKKPIPEKGSFVGVIELERKLRSMYSNEDFQDYFGINTPEIADFISFFQAEGFPQELLKPEKEMDLLQYLIQKSESFKAQDNNQTSG